MTGESPAYNDPPIAFLASIVETSADAIIGGSLDGKIISWNGGATAMLGYEPGEIIGRSLGSIVPPEREPIFQRKVLEQLRQGENVVPYDGVALCKNGTRLDVSVSLSILRDDAGQPSSAAAILRDISLHKKAEETTRLLASIVQSSHDAIFTTALDGRILSWNHGAEAMYGYPAEEIVGKPVSVLAPSLSRPELRKMRRLRRGKHIADLETTSVKSDGSTIQVSVTISPIDDTKGVIGYSVIARDISDRKRAAEAIAESEKKYRSLLENIPDVVWTADLNGHTVFVSAKSEQIYGYPAEEICHHQWWFSRIHPDDAQAVKEAYDAMFTDGQLYDVECRFQKKNGEWIWIHDRATSTHRVDGILCADGIVSDITAQKRLQEELKYYATHDQTTGLPNSRVFEEHCREILSHSLSKEQKCALLYLDVDNFKTVNDSLGHGLGDSLLRHLGQRLSGCVRRSEMVSRSRGDEFMLLLTGVDDKEAAAVAQRVLDVIGEPFHVNGSEMCLGASIGIALSPAHGRDLATLEGNADTAMYAAKRQGKHRFQIFTEEMRVALSRRLELEAELRQALDRAEFYLQYQPQFSVPAGGITGVEALLRWKSRRYGTVSPSEFIPILEDNGLICSITPWILEQACRSAQTWLAAGCRPVHLAVNISAVHLERGDVPDCVTRAIMETGFRCDSLVLELTESALMRNVSKSTRQLSQLQKLGVGISLDDFGTGYSSLSYLEHLPIDTLKIDRSFVKRIGRKEKTHAMVAGIVALAHSLGKTTVAEGVERASQLEALRAIGCDQVQGFLLGRPVDSDVIQAMLQMSAPLPEMLYSASVLREGQPAGFPKVKPETLLN